MPTDKMFVPGSEGRRRSKVDEALRKRQQQEWHRLKDDRGRTWTPWLLIRYTLTDVGLRPLALGAPYWASPDVYLESSDPLGRGVPGEDNFVHARIFNLGMATSAPTRVDFYWADPSLGLGADTMNHIGTEWVEVDHYTVKNVR